jgi:hypothetical protein
VLGAPGGVEILDLDGEFIDEVERFSPQSWLRIPPGLTLQASAASAGCTVWMKTGHLS